MNIYLKAKMQRVGRHFHRSKTYQIEPGECHFWANETGWLNA